MTARAPEELPHSSPASLSEPPPGAPEAELLPPGHRIAERYEIIRPLGEGATAAIYLARHLLINRPVAIKILHADVKTDARMVERFLNEGRAVGSMGHPHIVQSTDMGYLPSGEPFLVLEYLEGRDLGNEVAAVGALDIGRALRIAAQCASALGAAHSHGIVHRDLKAENVFLVQKVGHADHVKLLDFGISKFSDGGGKTEAGVIYGTLDYMSPEQVGATDAVDARTDVYALGVVLYHALTGHLPFENEEFPAVLRSIVVEAPIPARSWRNEIPEEVCTVLRRCLQKRPDHRYQTMSELEGELAALVEMFAAPPSLTGTLQSTAGTAPPAARTEATSMAPVPPSILPTSAVPSQQVQVVTQMTAALPTSPVKRWVGAAVLGLVAVGAAIGIGRQVGIDKAKATATAAVPAAVPLRVTGAAGLMTFRGREFVLPFKDDVKSNTERERIDLKLGNDSRTVWLVLDKARHVVVAPTKQ